MGSREPPGQGYRIKVRVGTKVRVWIRGIGVGGRVIVGGVRVRAARATTRTGHGAPFPGRTRAAVVWQDTVVRKTR